jgi:hypothetical protein
MQLFKFENYAIDFPFLKIPIEEVTKKDSVLILEQICKLLNLNSNNLKNSLFPEFEKKLSKCFTVYSSGDEIFAKLEKIGHFDSPDELYLIWNIDEVDKIKFGDLKHFWEYIWYSGTDEAVILYSKSLNNIFIVCDWGVIYYFIPLE